MKTGQKNQQMVNEVNRILDALEAISKSDKQENEGLEGGLTGGDFISSFRLRPSELIAKLEAKVIGQEVALRILATKICGHYNAIRSRLAKGSNPMNDVDRIKSNILLLGPTGSGKSYLLKLIAKVVGVPFCKVDATKFTEAGYVGGDVEDIIRDLARKTKKADGQLDVDLAQYGIVFIDEVDKIASSNGSIGPDVSRRGVQQALLTLIEDAEVSLKEKPDLEQIIRLHKIMTEGGKLPPQTINTKNILFVFAGAFPGLDEIVSNRLTSKKIGFGAEPALKSDLQGAMRQIKNEDLKKFGMEPELLGRIPVRVVLDELTQEHLFTILRNPDAPIVAHFSEVMESYGVEVSFEDEALRYIAGLAVAEGTGARGLLSAFESVVGVHETHLSEMQIKKFAFTLPMIDGTINPLEFIECLKNGYADRLDEARKRQEADQERKISIDGYIDQIKIKHGLVLKFEKSARDKIVELSILRQLPAREICHQIFGECEAAFGLLCQKGRGELVVTKEALENPMVFLESAFKK